VWLIGFESAFHHLLSVMKITTPKAIAIALLAGPIASLQAQALLVVPGTHATIQAAINASVNGDTVLVLPGAYVENLDVGGKDITIQSAGGALQTTIDGSAVSGPTVLFPAGSTRAAIFEGFTVRGGNHTGSSSYGGGIRVTSSSPTIRDCVVTDNISDSYGGGIGVTGNPAGPLFERCTVVGNHASGLGYASGGGIAINSATPGAVGTEIRHCTFDGNDAATRGGGIYLAYSPGCIIDSCRVMRNETLGSSGFLNGGAGIFLALGSATQVSNCRIWNNISNSDGGGVKWFNVTAAAFVNNTIVDNVGGGAAGYANGGAFGSNVVADLVNCIIWQNGGGAEFSFNGLDQGGLPPDAVVNHCVVTGGYTGTANLNVAPQLLGVASGNHHLDPGSPCIDAGNSVLLPLPTVDIDGQPRVISGSPDIGADEFDPSATLLYSDVATISVSSPGPVIYSVTNGPANSLYGVFFSISGTQPGTALFGKIAPLNVDALTTIFALVATTDGVGDGSVVLPALAMPPAFIGVTLSSAALVLGPTIDFSNDENVLIVP
tara:strand:+ start:3181 stop:4824 length:1644 start_codon:yes stop_codon:yes gene_type:complete